MREAEKRIERLFESAAKDVGNHVHLLLGDGTEVSYAQTWRRARCLAAVMLASGVRKGDRVASMMGNSRELVEFYIACGLCRSIAVTLNTLSTKREVQRIFADCEPRMVVAQPEFVERLANEVIPNSVTLKLVTQSTVVDEWRSYDVELEAAEPLPSVSEASPSEPAVMIYSSGTTGMPKGILLSHQGVIDNALRATEVLGYRSDDRSLTLLPMFSSFGFAFDMLYVVLARASVVILEKFEEQVALSLIERHKVSFLAGVPTMFARMFDPANTAERDLTSLRMIDVGGGPVSLRLKQTLKDDLGAIVVESYGLTEISPVASIQRPTEELRGSSCGRPLPTFEVRVIDAMGREVQAGEAGELLFRSNTFMLGYWNQPEQTAAAIRDGWLHTGDIGKVDLDGEIHVIDRIKDMIVTNGFNVYPKEVENAIAEIDAVQAVAVVGVPDEIRGEVVHAFVVPKQNMTLTEQGVLDYCVNNIARFKAPRSVSIVDELPLTASGKVQRFKLRQSLKQPTQGE